MQFTSNCTCTTYSLYICYRQSHAIYVNRHYVKFHVISCNACDQQSLDYDHSAPSRISLCRRVGAGWQVANSNMMRHERAIRERIMDDDDPHYSDKGKRQMSNNLLNSIRQAMPVLSEYTYIVHDHCSRIKDDPNRPSPRARFYRRSRHTGIPHRIRPLETVS